MLNKDPYKYQQKLNKLPQFYIEGSQISILEKPNIFHEKLLELINEAKNRIVIAALYLQDDECGRDIVKKIFERAQKFPTLKVTILVDYHRAQRGLIGKGKQQGNTLMYEKFTKENNINNVKFLGIPVKSKELFGVFHLKGFIIDDYVLYSGASINNIYLGYEGKYRLDRYHLINSQKLANSMVDVLKTITEHKAVQDIAQSNIPTIKEIIDQISSFKKLLKNIVYEIDDKKESRKQNVGLTPLIGLGNIQNKLNKTILNLFNSVEKDITICTPYFNPPKPIYKAIKCLLERGVKVTIIVGDKIANDFFIPESEPFNRVGAVPYLYEDNLRKFCKTFQNYIDLKQLNVMLWKDDTNTFHVKGLFVDNNYYLLTGNNINPRAWRMDVENGILINDQQEHCLQENFNKEKSYLLKNTKRISHYTEIDDFEKIPLKYKNYLKKFYRFKLDFLIKNII